MTSRQVVPELRKEQMLLTFKDEMQADYVKLMCRRKGITLESYIVDNMEWDSEPDCFENPTLTASYKQCYPCEYSEVCPDRVKKP